MPSPILKLYWNRPSHWPKIQLLPPYPNFPPVLVSRPPVAMQAGQQFLHYRLVEKIGEGGMGVVWKAEDTRLHRHVALKFIPEDVQEDEVAVERHLREARAASTLNHPHICSVHDIGEWEGRRFIVLELLEGNSLQQLTSVRTLELDEAVRVVTQVSDALDAAHAKGIIHRDIKTTNLFVNQRGEAKVLDFGLAKLAAVPTSPEGPTQVPGVTSPGAVVGTLSYMSPEQALGKDVDARTDIFSLGVVLYELLTGRRAFAGDTSAAIYDAILNKAPTAPVELGVQVPGELERILNKTLEKDPELRYQSAADLMADLRRFQENSNGQRVGSTPAARSNRSGSRRLPMILTVAAVVLIAVISWQMRPRSDTPLSESRSELELVSASRGPSIAVLPLINSSGDPSQEFFSDGLTADIIAELARYCELSVIAYGSTSQYKGSDADVIAIGHDLGAQYVLQGSIRKSGNRIKVSVELSDARDRTSVWGDSFERDLTASDLFELQDELTLKVVGALAGTYGALARAELPRTRSRNPASLDSYDCVLRAYAYLQIHNAENHLAALRCLEAVVASDPEYVDGRAWLGYLYADSWHHRWNEPADFSALDRALELTREAAQLDPANHVAHGALALTYFFRGEHERGKASAYRTIALAPNNAIWLSLIGTYLAQQGDFEHALPMTRKALVLDPYPPRWIRMAFFHDRYHHQDYEAALVEAKTIELDGDFRESLFLAVCYGQLGQPEQAQPFVDELMTRWGRPESELRQELVQRHAYMPEFVDHLLEGLEKAKIVQD